MINLGKIILYGSINLILAAIGIYAMLWISVKLFTLLWIELDWLISLF